MDKLENLILERVSGNDPMMPGISVGASSISGEFDYSHVAGPFSATSPDSRALKDDDVFWIASCTKLLTSICMLQCIEKGIFTLDQDITTVLPEWKDPDLLTGFDKATGKPILKKAKNLITIRHLLTHSAGMASGLNTLILQYQQYIDAPARTADTTVEQWGLKPLIYEPGEGWAYSSSIDWAGKMIERVTKQKLSEYMSAHIFKPLSMTSTTFRQSEITNPIVPTAQRPAPDTKKSNGSTKKLLPGTSFWIDGAKDDFGGGGAYGIVSDYMKVLKSVLKNDGVLLKRETVELMFEPHLSPQSHVAINDIFHSDKWASPSFLASITGNWTFFADKNNAKATPDVDWGLGGLLNMEGVEGGRRQGTMAWSGMPNLLWWIDPAAGVCGMFATQLNPPGDHECTKMNSEFEKTVYDELKLRRQFMRS